MALTKAETKLIMAAEQNRETAKCLLRAGFEAYGTDFCLRVAQAAFAECQQLFTEAREPDEEIEMIILLLGAAAVIDQFSDLRAKGTETHES